MCVDRIAVLIADDHPLMRAALRMTLSAEADLEVVGEAADGLEAIRLAERLRPDVVVMDVRMPNLDGISATRRLTEPERGLAVKVLVMSTFSIDGAEAVRAGASGYVLKDAPTEALVRAVRLAAAGAALRESGTAC